MNTQPQTQTRRIAQANQSLKNWWHRQTRPRVIGFCACWIAYGVGMTSLMDHASPRTVVMTMGIESLIATFIALAMLFKK